jgi:hypothetical protein
MRRRQFITLLGGVAPAGKHDDAVDALGLVGQLLGKMLAGQKPKPPEKPVTDSGYVQRQTAEPTDWLTY